LVGGGGVRAKLELEQPVLRVTCCLNCTVHPGST
jgi:hypothetical protein